jgi:flagellar protein FliO/FliZ
MQWLTNLPLGDNRTLQIVVLCAVVIVAIVALIIAYRALFGHRLRFSGSGRARQPRLGLVDAFSLDGQRQLVLVRRDNIEHLLMIGGPNDVVVESQIIRAQPQALGPREKDAALPSAAPKQVASVEAQPAPARVPAAPTISPLRAVMQTGPTAAQSPARAPVRSEPPVGAQARAPQPATPQPQQSLAPQPPTPPQPSASLAPPLTPKPQPAAEPAEGRNAPSTPKPSVLPLRHQGNLSPTRPSPLPPPIVIAAPGPTAPPVAAPNPKLPAIPTPAGSTPKAAPSPQVVPTPPSTSPPKTASNTPPPAAPSTAPAATAATAKNDPFAELDSLEAEMARLLGRDP